MNTGVHISFQIWLSLEKGCTFLSQVWNCCLNFLVTEIETKEYLLFPGIIVRIKLQQKIHGRCLARFPTHTHTHAHTHTHTWTHMHTHTRTHTHAHTRTHTHTDTRTRAHTRTHTHTHTQGEQIELLKTKASKPKLPPLGMISWASLLARWQSPPAIQENWVPLVSVCLQFSRFSRETPVLGNLSVLGKLEQLVGNSLPHQ